MSKKLEAKDLRINGKIPKNLAKKVKLYEAMSKREIENLIKEKQKAKK